MTIQEMHQTFRVFAQQMGMQLVRAILPEEIDVYLNTAINERVREVILSNLNVDSTGKLIVNSNISPINYIRTLYRTSTQNLSVSNSFGLTGIDAMYFTSFAVSYANTTDKYKCRIIEPDELYNTINDFCNAPSKEFPIITISTLDNGNLSAQIYNDNNKVTSLIINYIANPTKVSLASNVDCNLPDYTHNDIVQLACQKYFVSVGATTQPVNKQ